MPKVKIFKEGDLVVTVRKCKATAKAYAIVGEMGALIKEKKLMVVLSSNEHVTYATTPDDVDDGGWSWATKDLHLANRNLKQEREIIKLRAEVAKLKEQLAQAQNLKCSYCGKALNDALCPTCDNNE